MGIARVVLTAMGSDGYALWANEGLHDKIDKVRHQVNAIGSRLEPLAVRWPDPALELNAVERHLGTMPTHVEFLVQRVLDPNNRFADYLNELKAEHEAIVDALNRSIQKLAEPTDTET